MREKIKSWVLVLNIILLAALFLISLTISLEPIANGGPLYAVTRWIRGDSVPKKNVESGTTMAAFPFKLAVVLEEGMFGTYKREQIEPFYEKLRPLFNEAIGSAEMPQEITAEQYTDLAMHSRSICLEYDGRIPLYAMRIWSGVSGANFDYNVRSINFCDDGQRISVVFYDYISDKFYSCATSADIKMFADIVAGIEPNGAYFAGEDSWYEALHGDEQIFTESNILPVYDLMLPEFVTKGELSSEILESFAMSQYLTEVFKDTDKAQVYVQGSSVLRLEANGRLIYSAPEADAAKAMGGESQNIKVALIDQVRKMAESVLEDTEGTKVYFREITEEVGGEYEIIFGRECGGVPIGDYASKPVYAKIAGGAIVYFEMQIYNLSQSGEAAVIPYHQAMATLEADSEKLRLSVRYSSSDGKMMPYLSKTIDARNP